MAAKELLSVRIPSELMGKIAGLAAETKRDKTSVAVELLQRGLDSANESPIESANFVSTEKFDSAIATLREEISELKKLELVA